MAARRSGEVVAVDDESAVRTEAGCPGCLANGVRRCAPFASAGPEKCQLFPECCNWCRVTWCPNNRAKDLYASRDSAEQALDQAS